MYLAIRFLFGLAVGSFINVLATRYDPDKFLLTKQTLGGRSHCPNCKRNLTWFELIPVISFVALGGKCFGCKKNISFIYPIGELLAGLIFTFVPEKIYSLAYGVDSFFSPQVLLWVGILLLLQLLTFIDFKLQLIPDEGSLLLIIFGILATFVYPLKILGLKSASFIGHWANLFGFDGSMWGNRLLAVLIGVAFFGLLIIITRMRGMGMGDLKLSLGLGLTFGWPDIAIIIGLAFIIGAIVGGLLMLFRKAGVKTAVPFVPFLAISAAVIFFFGSQLLNWYFSFLMV